MKEGKANMCIESEDSSQKESDSKADMGNQAPLTMIATRATDYGIPDVKRDRIPLEEKGSKVKPTEAREAEEEEVTNNLTEESNNHLGIDAVEFKQEQASDPTLKDLWNRAKTEKEPYVISKDILYKRKETLFEKNALDLGKNLRLVVPIKYRQRLLELGHDSKWAGHRGVKATKACLRKEYTWPGMDEEVAAYVRSCPICQKTANVPKNHRVPLQETPIVEVPFQTVVIDLCGPISPASSSGKKYVLILVDQMTHWPEFIPLGSMKADKVCKALIEVFSRVGIPKYIISDNGTHFKNQLVQGMEKMLGISPIFSTVEHHETAGSAERMIRVLRDMLKKVTSDEPRSWELALPFLAFSCRQIPSTVTGFAPFELLYSHDVIGPLQILRDAWTGQLETPTPKRSVVEYLTMTKTHMQRCAEIATEHTKQARQSAKYYYDKHSSDRNLEPDEEVLLLRHATENKLLARWEGPFKILRKLSNVNYEIDTDKGKKVYHINLLRKWFNRSELCLTPSVNVVLTADPPQEEYETLPVVDDSSDTCGVNEHLTAEQKSQLQEVISEFSDRFSGQLGRTALIKHKITLTKDKPIAPKMYRIPECLKDKVHEQIRTMLENGLIEESTSAYASPIVCVTKKDKSIRICADLRAINSITVPDEYPASDMRNILERAAGSMFVTGLDLQQAFYQVELEKGSRPYTAFRTPHGLFQYTVLPNGARNASKCFQRLADQVLKGAEEYSAAHVDDILVFSRTWEEHIQHLKDILARLRKANLTAKLDKCQFGQRSIKVLGHVLENGLIKPDPEKISAIKDYPIPKTKRQVRAILGLANFYRRHLPNFAEIVAPLTELTRKDKPDRVKWTEKEDQAFNGLKQGLTSERFIIPPDITKPFILRCDASGTGLGAALLQKDEQGTERPISYASRKLLDREIKMSTVERETLCVVWALNHFQQYTYGAQVDIYTDHNCLRWLQTMANTNPRLTRWALAIQRYDVNINYVPGKQNGLADGLSRAHMEA